MPKVLIAEDDRIFLKRLSKILGKYSDSFEVICVENGKKAIEILNTEQISLLVTDIQMPEVDGLELLAYVTEHYPVIPCFVMTAYETPELREKLPKDLVQFLSKPFDIEALAGAIKKTLERKIPRGAIYGISVSSFLYMIELEQKTCLFEVILDDDEKGLMYFDNGILYDAVYSDLNGEEAAIAIIANDKAMFRFKDFPDKKVIRRVETDLPRLIEDALKHKDDFDSLDWDEILTDDL